MILSIISKELSISMWIIDAILIILLILLAKNTIKIIGKAGEFWVKKELKKLDKNDYIILNDIMIKSKDRTHQIDHIVISKYGIFVIETKHYHGYIKGNEYDKKWLQSFNKKNKNYINNPTIQNYGHMVALKELLDLDEDKFISVICFSGQVKLNVTAKKSRVLYINDLINTIKSYQDEIINNREEIANKILEQNIKDKKSRREHIKYIKTNIIKDDSNKCPRCGGNLIERNGKYGTFIGCSNYPKCNYTTESREVVI